MNIKKAYHSCFLTDVQIADDFIRLLDSSRNTYYIDISNKDALSSFKFWFKNVFIKGIPQTLTVFEYEIKKIDEGESGAFILKFCNLNRDDKKSSNENLKTV